MLRPRGRLDSVCELCLELERRSSLFLPLRVVGSLSISAAQGRLEHVQHYVEHVEDDVNVRDAMGSAPLHHAAAAGHATIVRYLLVHGADIEARVGDEQDTALHLAARLGHDGVVSALLAQGANSEARNSMLLTPLLLATQHNRIAAMQVLLAGGARLDAPWLVDYDSARDVAEPMDSVASRRRHDSEVLACDRGTCVHLAAVVGHVQAAKLLIAAAGIDANLPTSRQYATPLHLAVRFGHAALASTLLSLGADVRARDVEGREPLHIASDYAYHRVLPDIQHGALERAHVAAVDVLLSAGAEVDARDASGKTALQLAVKRRHLLVGRALVEAGAMRRSRAGLLMLGLSAWAHEPRKLKVLMSAGKASGDDDSKRSSCTLSLADSELSDAEHDDDWSWSSDPAEGAACLHAACLAHDRRGLLFLMLHSNEDIDSGAPAALGPDVEGLTALQLAARDGWLRGVDALLTHGANAQARAPHDGSTALHLAAERGHISVVARILAANINVNIRDAHAATPLLRALRHGRGLMVRILLQRGADLPAWDDEGHDDSVLDDMEPELTTTLHVAAFYGALDRVKELVETGVAVDATDADGVTPAWLAALAGQFAVVAFLVGRGAELRSLPDSDSDESDEGDDRVWLSASSKPLDDDHSQLDSRRRSI